MELDQKQLKLLAIVKNKMKTDKKLLEHSIRVLNLALDLHQNEREGSKEIIIASCLLHDLGKTYKKSKNKKHASIGAKKAKNILKTLDYDKESIKKVSKAIKRHSLSSKKTPKTIEEQILFDADKLDLIGGVGILRTCELWTDEDELKTIREKKSLKIKSIGLIKYLKDLKQVENLFFTKSAIERASARLEFIDDFIEQLKLELVEI